MFNNIRAIFSCRSSPVFQNVNFPAYTAIVYTNLFIQSNSTPTGLSITSENYEHFVSWGSYRIYEKQVVQNVFHRVKIVLFVQPTFSPACFVEYPLCLPRFNKTQASANTRPQSLFAEWRAKTGIILFPIRSRNSIRSGQYSLE